MLSSFARSRLMREEDGAVTIDWVVLTASIVSLGMIAGTLIWGDTVTAADRIAVVIGQQEVDDGSN